MSIPERGWRQHVLRAVLALLIMMTPLVDRPMVPVLAAALGTLLAYDGLAARQVGWSLALVAATEAVYGMNLGVLSLAYVLTAFVLAGARRFVAFTPLVRDRDWDPVSVVRAILLGLVLAFVLSAWSLAVMRIFYGHGGLAVRFLAAYAHPVSTVLMTGAVVSVLTLLLHRIDVPFRRPITFGI